MDHRPEALTDVDLDREIQAALAVGPSPQFAARVGARVGAQPIAPTVPWGWAIAAGCAVVVAIFMSNEGRPGVARLEPSTPTAVTQPEISIANGVRTLPDTSKSAEVVNSGAISESGPRMSQMPITAGTAILPKRQPAVPEVIVDPGNVQALQQLIVSARERRFEASFDDNPQSIPWETVELTGPPPIIIEPLDPSAANN